MLGGKAKDQRENHKTEMFDIYAHNLKIQVTLNANITVGNGHRLFEENDMARIKQIIFSDFFDTLTNGALVLFAYWYIYKVTRDQSYISLLGLISMIATLFTFVGGYLSDKVNKIYLLKTVVGIRVLNTILGLAIYHLFDYPILSVMVTVVINSILNIVYSPLTESIVPSIVHGKEDLITANSWVSIANQLSSVLSAGLSAIFIFFGNVSIGLVLSLVLYVLSYLLITRLSIEAKAGKKVDVTSLVAKDTNKFLIGMKIIRKNFLISVIVPVALVTNFCFWTVWLLMPKLSIDVFSGFTYMYNSIDLSFTVGSILGAFAVNVKHKGKKIFTARNFPYFLLLQGVMILLIGLFSLQHREVFGIVGVVISWLGYGICNSIGSILYFSTVQLSVPSNHIGMVIGAILTIFSLANPIAAITSAPLSHITTTPIIIFLLGTVMMLASVPVFF